MNRQNYFVALALLFAIISSPRLIAQELSGDRSAGGAPPVSETPVSNGEQFLAEIRYAFTNQQWEQLSKLTGQKRLKYAKTILQQRNPGCWSRHEEHVHLADSLLSSATLPGSQTDAGRFLIVWGKPQTMLTEPVSTGGSAGGEAGSLRAQYTRITWIYTKAAGVRGGEARVVVFSDIHSEGVFELEGDIFIPYDRSLPTRSFSIDTLPMGVTWQQNPTNANGGIYGSVLVSNATAGAYEAVVVVVAVNSYGRATALGYQRISLQGNTTRGDIWFGAQLPPGDYVVHADAVAEMPLLGLIYRANTHAAKIEVASR